MSVSGAPGRVFLVCRPLGGERRNSSAPPLGAGDGIVCDARGVGGAPRVVEFWIGQARDILFFSGWLAGM